MKIRSFEDLGLALTRFEELFGSPAGSEAAREFHELSRALRAFEDEVASQVAAQRMAPRALLELRPLSCPLPANSRQRQRGTGGSRSLRSQFPSPRREPRDGCYGHHPYGDAYCLVHRSVLRYGKDAEEAFVPGPLLKNERRSVHLCPSSSANRKSALTVTMKKLTLSYRLWLAIALSMYNGPPQCTYKLPISQ